jgi:hypothetical protein
MSEEDLKQNFGYFHPILMLRGARTPRHGIDFIIELARFISFENVIEGFRLKVTFSNFRPFFFCVSSYR